VATQKHAVTPWDQMVDFAQQFQLQWVANKYTADFGEHFVEVHFGDVVEFQFVIVRRPSELSNKAHSLYEMQNCMEQGKVLKMNCSTDGVTVWPVYKNPFDMIFNRAKNEEWCALGDDFRTWMRDTDPCDWVKPQSSAVRRTSRYNRVCQDLLIS
jgi:hypothetical protein